MQLFSAIKQIAVTAAIVALAIACRQHAQKEEVKASAVTPSVSALVHSIASYPTVNQEIVGIGIPSEQYMRFIELSKQATDKELIELTNHANGNVRAYSFWALAKRSYPGLKRLVDTRLKDTASISFFSGCLMNSYSLKEFYISILTPNSIFSDCKKLTRKEIEFYREKMGS